MIKKGLSMRQGSLYKIDTQTTSMQPLAPFVFQDG